MCVSLPSLRFADVGLSIACAFVGIANFLGLEFSVGLNLWTSMLKSGFVMEYLVSPSMEIGSFARYSGLISHLLSFSVCMITVQNLLAFRVSIEKSSLL